MNTIVKPLLLIGLTAFIYGCGNDSADKAAESGSAASEAKQATEAAATDESAKQLTVVSFGGAYGAAQKKHMLDPYETSSGTKLLFEDYSGGVAELKAQVDSGNVKWDVLDLEFIDAERACSEGMLEVFPMDQLEAGEDGTAAATDFIPEALANECLVGNIIWSTVFAHRGDIATAPTTVADIFDTAKIPGKRAFRKRPQINLEWALMADGVAKGDVYSVLATEEGVARAFAKLDTIKDDIVWFDSWSQAPQLLNDGGAVIVQSANGRIYSAIKEDGSDFNIVWDGQVYDLDGWAIVAGSENKEEAINFIKAATQTIPEAGMQDVAYGPTRISSAVHVADDVKAHLPSAHLDVGLKADAGFWADNDAALSELFTAWLIK